MTETASIEARAEKATEPSERELNHLAKCLRDEAADMEDDMTNDSPYDTETIRKMRESAYALEFGAAQSSRLRALEGEIGRIKAEASKDKPRMTTPEVIARIRRNAVAAIECLKSARTERDARRYVQQVIDGIDVAVSLGEFDGDHAISDALTLAQQFHEVYERLAPSFGYETRTETRKFDPESPNGKLMVAVCGEILSAL